MARGRPKGSTKKPKEVKEMVEEIKEPIEEVKEQVEEVQEPVKEEKILSEEELRQAIHNAETKKAEYDAQLAQIRVDRNKSIIEAQVCVECGNLLNIEPDQFMQSGSKSIDAVCTECDMVNAVQVQFRTSPEHCDPIITIRNKGLDYIVTPINALTHEQLIKRMQYETNEVMGKRHKENPRIQLLIRAVNELLKE